MSHDWGTYPVTRRTTLAAFGATLTVLASPFAAFAQTQKIRYAADTPNGRIMLGKYAEAVRRMSDPAMAQSNPRAWLFQWYIHAVPGHAKQTELNRVFGNTHPAQRILAEEVWSTCQAHSIGRDPDMFLPWHRMYLLTFEAIIRAELNDDGFTLPYWDYTQPGKRALPSEFRTAAPANFARLFRPNRKNTSQIDINAGDPMDKGATTSPYNLNAMLRPDYSGSIGFCSTLDNGLHGNVHGGIGDSTNMGAVPTAAGDPIFWLHHCNIDRIWAAWNAAGGVNPNTSAKFAFAAPDPAGQRIEMDAATMGSTVPLGYRYDSLPIPPPKPISSGTSGGPPRTVATSARGVRLGTGATRIPLRTATADGVIAGSVSSATATGQIFVVLTNLRSNIEPGTLYEAFVDLPARANLAEKRARYLGTFSFFGRSGEHVHESPFGPSFEVTERFRILRQRNLLGAETAITIIPIGSADPAAAPIVGTIEILRK